jgi:hypothetical protein
VTVLANSVQLLLEDLAHDRVTLADAVEEFHLRLWPADPEPTPEQLAGVEDAPLPGPNSIDWVELTQGLTQRERRSLRAAYDAARH